MRPLKLAAGSLLALGLLTLGTPAYATTAPSAAGSVSSASSGAPSAVLTGTDDGGSVVVSEAKRKKKYKGGASYNLDTGMWQATVTNRETGVTTSYGSYNSRDEAQAEGEAMADYANKHGNVMDGPGCKPPVVC